MKIIKVFLLFIRRLFPSKIDRINKKLEKAAAKAVRERELVKKEVALFLDKKFGYKIGSKFIPKKGMNKSHIHGVVLENYGDVLKSHNLRLSKDLIWQ